MNSNSNSNNNNNNNSSGKTGTGEDALLLRRKQRKKRRRPVSGTQNNTVQNNHGDSLPVGTPCQRNESVSDNPCNSIGNADLFDLSSLLSSALLLPPLPTCWNDPFQLVDMAIDHDEYKRNAIEVLQVPLETGKLYHNEPLFHRALEHLIKENRGFKFGYSRNLPALPADRDTERERAGKENAKESPAREKAASSSSSSSSSTKSTAITPIILSGLLASLDGNNLGAITKRLCCSNPNCTQVRCTSFQTTHYSTDPAQSSSTAATMTPTTPTTTSAELVNYTVGRRRAALSRARVRRRRERTIRIAKPFLAVAVVVGLYCYAWSNLRYLLKGLYGVATLTATTTTVDDPLEADTLHGETPRVPFYASWMPSKRRKRAKPRLIPSSCDGDSSSSSSNDADADPSSRSDYAGACRMAEGETFELLTSPHNHRHTKLFAKAANLFETSSEDHLPVDPESRNQLTQALMQHDDEYYRDDTKLPLYALHMPLVDEETSMIPLEKVIHTSRKHKRDTKHRQRWRRRRRMQKRFQQEYPDEDWNDLLDPIDECAGYQRLSLAVQLWGDTTVNRLVREAIVEAQHTIGDRPLKILDVGSGMSGTLFSLLSRDFSFFDWSYHGISLSKLEIRRARQLVDATVRPMLSRLADATSTEKGGGKPRRGGSACPDGAPPNNITIRHASFDNPLPSEEYTTMIAIESLAHSNDIVHTLNNLARSLKPGGILIVIDDVVAPWVKETATSEHETNDPNKEEKNDKSNEDSAPFPSIEYVEAVADLSSKPSLLTHEEWLERFARAGLAIHRPTRDLLLELDVRPIPVTHSDKARFVTGLPFVWFLFGERPWYSMGHGLLDNLIDWFGSDRTGPDDDGSVSNRALLLMEYMMQNDRGEAYRNVLRNRGDLGYYMYVCIKQ